MDLAYLATIPDTTQSMAGAGTDLVTWVIRLVLLACHVVLIANMFREEKAIHGILGILIPYYAILWGWFKWEEGGLKFLVLLPQTGILILFHIAMIISLST
jgi:hypothetical protein